MACVVITDSIIEKSESNSQPINQRLISSARCNH